MIAKRKKHLNLRLPPRVDPYLRKDGTYSFRFKHWDGYYIKLGSDLEEARRKGYALLAGKPEVGTLAELVSLYWKSVWFENLSVRTKADYEEHSKPVLRVFGQASPDDIEATDIAKYLRVERKSAPVRANREIRGFLSSVYEYGIEIGAAKSNPCRQVRRNPEKPRNRKVETKEIAGVVGTAQKIGPSAIMIVLAAKLCAIAGRRREDVLKMKLPHADDQAIVVVPQKTRYDETPVTIEIPITPGIREILNEIRDVHKLREQAFDEREAKRAAKGRVGKERRPVRSIWMFCTNQGTPYSDAGFKTIWNRIQVQWKKDGGTRFTFHDLRAYYVTEAKTRGWDVADTTGHKDESTANRIYDRRRVRKARPLE